MNGNPRIKFDNCIDAEIFKNKSDLTELQCPINFGILNEPVSLACCGNVFCKTCITEWLEKKNLCPCCRKIIDFPIGQPIVLIKNTIKKQEVTCKNRAKGCQWEGQFEKMIFHFESDCGYHEAVCDFCSSIVLQKDLPDHKSNCPLRPIKCEYCTEVYLHSDSSVILTNKNFFINLFI